jgi:hypothetical protein
VPILLLKFCAAEIEQAAKSAILLDLLVGVTDTPATLVGSRPAVAHMGTSRQWQLSQGPMNPAPEFDLRVPWRRHWRVALVIVGTLALSLLVLPHLHPPRGPGDPSFPDKLYNTTLRFSPSPAPPPAAPAPR